MGGNSQYEAIARHLELFKNVKYMCSVLVPSSDTEGAKWVRIDLAGRSGCDERELFCAVVRYAID